MSLQEAAFQTLISTATMDIETLDTQEESEEDEIWDDLIEGILTLQSHRYLQVSLHVPKSTAWFSTVLPNFDDKRFKVMLRVSRPQFEVVLNLIRDHPIFHTTMNQFPISSQLAVVLYRLGSYGSGSSIPKMATLFGIEDGGTIDRITHRVFKALISHRRTYISWPSPEERIQLANILGDRFPQCIGYLDGTDFNLAVTIVGPFLILFQKATLFCKGAMCDHNLKIRYLQVGFPGSAHDARIFNNSDLGRNPALYLSGSQWLAADSAYKVTEYVITPFRKNSGFRTLVEREKFNKYFSGFRVKIEQCFGILKEKFLSLKEIRTRVKNVESNLFVCVWIQICVIIHILLPFYEYDDFEYQPEPVQQLNDNFGDEINGSLKRSALFSLLKHNL